MTRLQIAVDSISVLWKIVSDHTKKRSKSIQILHGGDLTNQAGGMVITEEIFKGGLFKPSIKQGNVRALQVVTLRMDDVEILGQRIKSRKTVSLTRLVPSLLPKNITVVWKILFEVNLYLGRYMGEQQCHLSLSFLSTLNTSFTPKLLQTEQC